MLCAKQMVLVFAGAFNKLEFDAQANIELTQIRFTKQIFSPKYHLIEQEPYFAPVRKCLLLYFISMACQALILNCLAE